MYCGYSHDIKLAVFEVFEAESGLEMNVTLDKEDFLSSLESEFGIRPTSDNLQKLAFEYLDSKVSIKVNGECTSFAILEIVFSNLNIHLKGSLNIQIAAIEEIHMTNSCMVDLIEDHDNIMKLKLNNKTRSFRLNRSRTSTTATY